MPEYGFVLKVPTDDGETRQVEYRTSGPALSGEEAVVRCYQKHPEGEIIRPLYGDVDGVDLSPGRKEFTQASELLEEGVDVTETERTIEEDIDLGGSDEEAEEDDEEDPDDDEGDVTGVTEAPFDPSDYTVAELKSALESTELTEDELRAVLQAEFEGKDRTSAVAAIEEAQAN